MVFNKEINDKSKSEKNPKNLGYFVCEKCKGYYELQPGESPEKYEKCECGGKLRYYSSFSQFDKDNFKPIIQMIFIIVGIILILAIIFLIYNYFFGLPHKKLF